MDQLSAYKSCKVQTLDGDSFTFCLCPSVTSDNIYKQLTFNFLEIPYDQFDRVFIILYIPCLDVYHYTKLILALACPLAIRLTAIKILMMTVCMAFINGQMNSPSKYNPYFKDISCISSSVPLYVIYSCTWELNILAETVVFLLLFCWSPFCLPAVEDGNLYVTCDKARS